MSTKHNKDISRRFLEELWNKKNVSIINELIADTYIDHTPPPNSMDEKLQGPAAFNQLFTALQDAFSDIRVSIGDQIAQHDRVATPVTWVYTLKSNDSSIVSQVVTIMGIGIDRIHSGKIVENWNTLDVTYRLINLLGIPDPLSPPAPPPPQSCAKGCDPGYVCQSDGYCHRG
jgi:predicted SnoaL-like aldol condensation-catalyzing enzyme